jgi:hypothetical protein
MFDDRHLFVGIDVISINENTRLIYKEEYKEMVSYNKTYMSANSKFNKNISQQVDREEIREKEIEFKSGKLFAYVEDVYSYSSYALGEIKIFAKDYFPVTISKLKQIEDNET